MSQPFSIKSTHSDRRIQFSKYDGENFWVELKGGINAAIKVNGYAPHSHDLAHWFSELGEHSEPWENESVWESLEGDFIIKATCDSQGHIHFLVSLRDMSRSYEEAFITAGLDTELGQLNKIASGARSFFAK